MEQAPAHVGGLVTLSIHVQGGMLEQDEQIVSDDADTKESGIGGKLPAGHAFHAKADLQFLDAVFGDLAPLALPGQGVYGRFDAVAGDHAILGLVIEQFGLALVIDHDRRECVRRLVHVVQRLGDGAVGVVLQVCYGNVANCVLRGAFKRPPMAKVLPVSSR